MRCRNSCFTDKLRNSKLCCVLGAAAVGLFVMTLCLSCFSFLTANLDASEGLVSAMAAISLCAGSFAAGYRAACKRRKHGVLLGIGCGIVIYCAVFFFGLVLLGSLSGAGTFVKLVLVILCSCIGGACGVNKRHCKPPR